MKSTLSRSLLLVAFALGAVPASAAEQTWAARQVAGTQRDCCAVHMNTRWSIILETDKHIVLRPDNRSFASGWRLRANQLNPDGAGLIEALYHNGRPARFEFTAGHGPRTVYFTYDYKGCVWELQPA